MVIWSKYVYPKQPLQMWYCKIPVAAHNLTRVRRFKVSVFVWARVPVCALSKMRKRSTALLTAESTAPAGLRTVLHHGDSRIHDVTFEPQPGPDQMLDFLIKYLLASVNHPTSVRQCDGCYETRLLTTFKTLWEPYIYTYRTNCLQLSSVLAALTRPF